jgi:predicted metal-binding membrane protein
MAATAMEAVLKRDRLVVLSSLVALCFLAWLYLFQLAGEMDGMQAPAMDMPGMEGMPGMSMGADDASPVAAEFFVTALMWIVMMVGMMLPSAAPGILLFSALERKRAETSPILPRTAIFVAGYFVVWGTFSLAAAAAQIALSRAELLSPQMAMTSAILGGAIFVFAGLYEFTPLKDRCLSHCRSPLDWITHHWRRGVFGALRMGIGHGIYCVGCCWVLMLLLFAGGVMNLLWVALIAAIVLVQKLLPGGLLVARIAGVGLIVWGLVLIARPFGTS